MCSPVRASQIAHALKPPRVSVLRSLEELMKHGYLERVGNAYRVTDKVNIPEPAEETAAANRHGGGDCEEVGGSGRFGLDRPSVTLPHHERIRRHCYLIRNGARRWRKG